MKIWKENIYERNKKTQMSVDYMIRKKIIKKKTED